ncbi:IclR family transcriptional regulator [Aquabacter spiritensis]|uniref:IclR family transcriptional regulator n=1 Tax=Aquabacter spiritensis TaxID=933073 RepID=A0A4V2UYN8_9HYPH|nr:IclR family transcriptional regulator C-terminal domain-containing protein [Aquabacter spiritensis]TCT08158.1 IclR family transcriptional regulator [Aquabacter spiritensis]
MEDLSSAPRRRGRPASAVDGGEVQSLDRAIALLRLVADMDGMTLSEIAKRAELPASTAHRLLATLQKRQLVTHDQENGLWTVGLGLFRIGAAYLRIRKLPDIGRPVIRRLLHETEETVNLAMFDGNELVVVAQAEGHSPVRAFFRLGARLPLHASAAGKAILAAASPAFRGACLAQIRYEAFTVRTHRSERDLVEDLLRLGARGYSVDEEEHTLGMCAVAAAIFNEWREPIGAVSVAGPSVRMSDDRIARLGRRVAAAADEMTRLYSGVQDGPSEWSAPR